jgi:16S rRNA (uracil1498-N3)-methyltransferase
MSERFYVNSELGPGEVVLQGPEAHHLAAVCRLRPGAAVCLFNGDGRQFPARVVAVGKKSVTLLADAPESPSRELGFRLEVATPLPKGDRAQFLVEKLTELGVTDFVPLQTARSVVHPREGKLDRLQRHVIEASKQCGRNVLLRVHPLVEWRDYCRRADLPAHRLLAGPGGEAAGWAGGDVAAAVGPEGGFSADEVAEARAAGWRLVGLGPRVLRVETAALALAVLLGSERAPRG